MDAIRPAPASPTHGSQSARQKTGTENAQAAGPFFSLLAGMDAQAEEAMETPISKQSALDDSSAVPSDAFSGIQLLFAASASALHAALPDDSTGFGDTQLFATQSGSVVAGEVDAMVGGLPGARLPGEIISSVESAAKTDGGSGGVQPMLAPYNERSLAELADKAPAISSGESLVDRIRTSSSRNALPQAEEPDDRLPRSFAAPVQSNVPAGVLPSMGGARGVGANQAVAAVSQPFPVVAASAMNSVDGLNGLLDGSSLVAQTGRIDAASAGVGAGVWSASTYTPPTARRSPHSTPVNRMKPVAQVIDASARSVTQTGAASVLSTSQVVRGASESKLLVADDRRMAVSTAGAKEAGDLGIFSLPAPVGVVSSDTPRERAQFASGRQEFGGPMGAALNADNSAAPALEATGGAVEGMASASEEAIAEQVTYWLSENLKNAELTVEHAGHPVEVRVSLAGNEAHVAFRSDMAQTRELLDARMEQLRELLQEHGLVLSGATVDAGSSGRSDSSGDQEASENAGASNALRPVEPSPTRTQQILTKTSVDLYV